MLCVNLTAIWRLSTNEWSVSHLVARRAVLIGLWQMYQNLDQELL